MTAPASDGRANPRLRDADPFLFPEARGAVSDRFAPLPPTVDRVSEITLLALKTAITIGAQLARFSAREWGLRHLEQSAEQITGHLLTRVVECPGHPGLQYSGINSATVATVGIRIHRRAEALIIDVWDIDPIPPDTGPSDSHMSAVRVLSRRWGTYLSLCGGKVVWAEIGADDHSPTGLAGSSGPDNVTPRPASEPTYASSGDHSALVERRQALFREGVRAERGPSGVGRQADWGKRLSWKGAERLMGEALLGW